MIYGNLLLNSLNGITKTINDMKTWKIEMSLENEKQAHDLLESLKQAFETASRLKEPLVIFEATGDNRSLKCKLK